MILIKEYCRASSSAAKLLYSLTFQTHESVSHAFDRGRSLHPHIRDEPHDMDSQTYRCIHQLSPSAWQFYPFAPITAISAVGQA
jgi:hypothetical protein